MEEEEDAATAAPGGRGSPRVGPDKVIMSAAEDGDAALARPLEGVGVGVGAALALVEVEAPASC